MVGKSYIIMHTIKSSILFKKKKVYIHCIILSLASMVQQNLNKVKF